MSAPLEQPQALLLCLGVHSWVFMISSINYQEIEALFILVVVGEAWKAMVVSYEIVSIPVISADHCRFDSTHL